MRGRVYELKEVKPKAAQPSVEELAHKVDGYLTRHAEMPLPDAGLYAAVQQPPQARRPAPHRPSSAQASSRAAAGASYAAVDGGPALSARAAVRAARPQSAQPALHAPAAAAPASAQQRKPAAGVDPFDRQVLLYAAGQQRANSIKAKFGSSLMI